MYYDYKTISEMTNLKEFRFNEGSQLPNFSLSETAITSRFKQLSNLQRNATSNHIYDNDDYLSDLLKVLKIKTLVVGVGGAGNNTVSRLQEMGLVGTETLNINTDAHDLYYSNAKKKLLIGKDQCNGTGSGNNPLIGSKAAEEDADRLNKILNADVVFLTCGLGGGTGTGAAPIIAREAKKNNSLVVSFCSIPFRSEGNQRRLRAKLGLKKLAKYSDSIIPIPNDNLLQLIPKAPILTCFKVMDEVLVRSIREIVTLMNNCGLINIDFADVKKILERTGNYPSGLIGITETLGNEHDIIHKSKLAIHNPLLKPNTNEVDRCLISVSSNHKLSLSNVDKIVSTISNEVPQNAKIKFGANMDPNLDTKIRIMVLGKGPISPYVRSAVNAADDIPFQ
ncbi:MAG: cell division protein FtsZ [Promethearchaeota archaeon]|nr:MAG: cell division protein FtsZ [Candidatus Lokiarchaeota archaeon]